MTRTYTRSMIAYIDDMFWDDFCLHAETINGVVMLGTVPTNRHGWPSIARYSERNENRSKLFWFIIRKIKQIDGIHHDPMARRRILYVRN